MEVKSKKNQPVNEIPDDSLEGFSPISYFIHGIKFPLSMIAFSLMIRAYSYNDTLPCVYYCMSWLFWIIYFIRDYKER